MGCCGKGARRPRWEDIKMTLQEAIRTLTSDVEAGKRRKPPDSRDGMLLRRVRAAAGVLISEHAKAVELAARYKREAEQAKASLEQHAPPAASTRSTRRSTKKDKDGDE
jgi:hypothetical protein